MPNGGYVPENGITLSPATIRTTATGKRSSTTPRGRPIPGTRLKSCSPALAATSNRRGRPVNCFEPERPHPPRTRRTAPVSD